MAKLLSIVAASVGGGIALGLGIRVGENLLHTSVPPGATGLAEAITLRIATLEDRLSVLDASPDTVDTVIAGHAAEINAIQTRLNRQTEMDLPNTEQILGTEIRGDLNEWVKIALDARLADTEAQIRTEAEEKQQAAMDAFVERVQTRVVQRISKLEQDVTAQGVALTGLGEYSMQTERNMQKLLVGIERLVSNPASSGSAPSAAPNSNYPFSKSGVSTSATKTSANGLSATTATVAKSVSLPDPANVLEVGQAAESTAPPRSALRPGDAPNFTKAFEKSTERRPGGSLFSRLFR